MAMDIILEKLTVPQEFLPRTKTTDAKLSEYVRMLKNGVDFDPIVVWEREGSYWIADGVKRYKAYKALGKESIKAQVRNFEDELEFRLFAIQANLKHGVALSQEERKINAQTLYKLGFDVERLVDIFGVSKATIYRWIKPILQEQEKEKKEKALQMYEEGCSIRDIQQELGVGFEKAKELLQEKEEEGQRDWKEELLECAKEGLVFSEALSRLNRKFSKEEQLALEREYMSLFIKERLSQLTLEKAKGILQEGLVPPSTLTKLLTLGDILGEQEVKELLQQNGQELREAFKAGLLKKVKQYLSDPKNPLEGLVLTEREKELLEGERIEDFDGYRVVCMEDIGIEELKNRIKGKKDAVSAVEDYIVEKGLRVDRKVVGDVLAKIQSGKLSLHQILESVEQSIEELSKGFNKKVLNELIKLRAKLKAKLERENQQSKVDGLPGLLKWYMKQGVEEDWDKAGRCLKSLIRNYQKRSRTVEDLKEDIAYFLKYAHSTNRTLDQFMKIKHRMAEEREEIGPLVADFFEWYYDFHLRREGSVPEEKHKSPEYARVGVLFNIKELIRMYHANNWGTLENIKNDYEEWYITHNFPSPTLQFYRRNARAFRKSKESGMVERIAQYKRILQERTVCVLAVGENEEVVEDEHDRVLRELGIDFYHPYAWEKKRGEGGLRSFVFLTKGGRYRIIKVRDQMELVKTLSKHYMVRLVSDGFALYNSKDEKVGKVFDVPMDIDIAQILRSGNFPDRVIRKVLDGDFSPTPALEGIRKVGVDVCLEGPPGVGKTFACVWKILELLILRRVQNPLYISFMNFKENYNAMLDSKDWDALLLDDVVLDDRGKYNLFKKAITYAYDHSIPLFLTTNDFSKVERFLNLSLYSRIAEKMRILKVGGKDLRVEGL